MTEKYAQSLSANILSLRKSSGLTQEALADKLSVSFQAVYKWENNQAMPEITLLPIITDVFNVSVDFLFGRKTEAISSLPWENDNVYRAVIFKGQKLLDRTENLSESFTFCFDGDIMSGVECRGNLSCGDIYGGVSVGYHIECGDISGSVSAGNSIECGDIGRSVSAEGSINCGDISGDAKAKGSICCGDIGGNAYSETSIDF